MWPAQAALSPRASSHFLHQPENHRSVPITPRRCRRTSQHSLPSANQKLFRIRRGHRVAQGGGAYGVGAEDERNQVKGDGGSEQ